jgi:hypothetical protein
MTREAEPRVVVTSEGKLLARDRFPTEVSGGNMALSMFHFDFSPGMVISDFWATEL